MNISKNFIALLLVWAVLSACNGSSEPGLETKFSLAISDAPVDGLSHVVICFNQVELIGEDHAKLFTVGDDAGVLPVNDLCGDVANTVGINLLDYTGDNSIPLINNVDLEPGTYSQLRLIMGNASFAVVDGDDPDISDNHIPVSVPSNELKLDGFTVVQGSSVAYTLEFDLRKSMVDPIGQAGYFLKPRGVRLVDNSTVGTLSGSASDAFITGDCAIGSPGPDMGLATVYLYSGTESDGSPLAIAGLEDNTPDDSAVAPLASVIVTDDGAGNYTYEIGFVPAGDYTVAITCATDDDPSFDNPNTVQDPDLGDAIVFIDAKATAINAKSETVVSFGD